MKSKKRKLAIAVLLVSGWCALDAGAQAAAAKEPVVDAGFAGTPIFETRAGSLSAGTAFLIRFKGETDVLLVTAQHIFGPAGGLKQDVPRGKMAEFIRKATLRDLVKDISQTTKATPLAIPEDIDAAVFRTALGAKAKPHPLAKENPKTDDVIWLVAALEGQDKNKILHRGTVVEATEAVIKCKFDDGNLVTHGASGAPYLNASGEVVGLHTGSFKNPGNVAGAVLLVETIAKAIQVALGK
jgi:hypothetical protein